MTEIDEIYNDLEKFTLKGKKLKKLKNFYLFEFFK